MQLTICTPYGGKIREGRGYVCVCVGKCDSHQLHSRVSTNKLCNPIWRTGNRRRAEVYILLDSPGVYNTESLLLIQQTHSTVSVYGVLSVAHPKLLRFFATLFLPGVWTLRAKQRIIWEMLTFEPTVCIICPTVSLLCHAEVNIVLSQGPVVSCTSSDLSLCTQLTICCHQSFTVYSFT